MIKKLMMALAIAAGAMVAQADFLWWQVAPQAGREFSSAELWTTDGTNKTYLDEVQAFDYNESTAKGTFTKTASTDITDYTGSEYSFFVELVTYADDSWSTETGRDTMAPVSYNDLLSGGYITAPGIGLPEGPSPSEGGINLGEGGGSAIPEPTSGMLMLLGGALMALRRRRRA